MTPQTPLLLVDNKFDRISQYAGATISASSEVVGHEARRVGSYRRDRQWWQAANDGSGSDHALSADLGVGETGKMRYLWLDRGHNLWGRTVTLEGGSDGSTYGTSVISHALPADDTPGGDPTTGWCVTEEGAAWSIASADSAALRYWRVRISNAAAFIPVVTGVMAGVAHQMLGYSATFDEDAAGRKSAKAESDAGYQATGATYSWRTLSLDLRYIGAAEYDGTMRTLRSLLFARSCPVVACMDYGTHPERAWMYRLDGDSWGMPKSRVYRSGQLRFRELDPLMID